MKLLTNSGFMAARSYLLAKARPLEQTLFHFHFEGGSQERVLEALAAFQNQDGGFGHGLEPDVRTAHSSAIATSHGFAVLRDVNAPSTSPLVQRAVDYLLSSYDPTRQVWSILPAEAEDAPHAPWWNRADLADNFGHFLVNPTVALIGHLIHYSELVPVDLLTQLTEIALTRLQSEREDLEMHDVMCYQGLLSAAGLERRQIQTIIETLSQLLPTLLTTDIEGWAAYGYTPLDAAPSPDAPLASSVDPAMLNGYLDYLIEYQGEDGAWPTRWSWDFVDAAAWAQAEREWKGSITLHNLLGLQAHGRLSAM